MNNASATTPPAARKVVARVANLKKTYRLGNDLEVHALRGVSFDFYEGDFVAIMGASGSGKSTLLNLLGCLDHPSSGSYFLGGQDVARMSDTALSGIRSRFIGFIFQSYNLIPQLTVVENIQVPLGYQRREIPGGAERCLKLARLVGLADRLHHRPSELSGGQQQRVAIARSLVNNPHIILADEPTGNLDSSTGLEIMRVLDALNRAGRTILMVTHEPDVAAFAHRTIRLRDGHIEQITENHARPDA
jgi:putative ABC transport system ATP-binding protein